MLISDEFLLILQLAELLIYGKSELTLRCFQGARCLAEPPTLRQIFHSNLNNSETKQEGSKKEQNDEKEEEEGNNTEDQGNKGSKRKFDQTDSSLHQGNSSRKGNDQSPKDTKLKKAKNVVPSFFSI